MSASGAPPSGSAMQSKGASEERATPDRDHCPACLVASDLTAHRDASAADWSYRRATLNFAIIVARRACPAYGPTTTSEEKP